MAYNDGVKSIPIAYIGVISVVVTIIIVMMLQVAFFGAREELEAANESGPAPAAELAELNSKQLTMLTRREMVDSEQGIVTVGITRAMDLVVKELSEGKTPSEVIGPRRAAAIPAKPDNPETPAAKPVAKPPQADDAATSDSAADDAPPVQEKQDDDQQ